MCKTSSGELLLREILKQIIDNNNVIYNHRGLGIKNSRTGNELEIDIYYPDYKLAFEFQGEEHFKETSFADSSEVKEIKIRDAIKDRFCSENGIKLVIVCAMNLNTSFRGTLHRALPDIKMIRFDRNNDEHIKKLRILEWKCKEYRKHLNKVYEGHTSAKSGARLWRETMKKQGIEIPEKLKRKTDISLNIQKAVEVGKYTDQMLYSSYRW